MNLFIDSISNPGIIIGFDAPKKSFEHLDIQVSMNESSKLIGFVNQFLQENSYSIGDIQNIIVVNGPGSFTGVRATVLIANTFAFRSDIRLTAVSYFDLFSNYPIIKQSSKRDVFIKKDAESEIEIVTNINCIQYIINNKLGKIYGDFDIFGNMAIVKKQGEDVSILHDSDHILQSVVLVSTVDYENIIYTIAFQNKKQIEPLYIKKPNIS